MEYFCIAKNYLSEDELKELAAKLDKSLDFNEYDELTHLGKMTSTLAKERAVEEFDKFRAAHYKAVKSDFDKLV